MATCASESKFDRNHSLAAGSDTVTASEVADQEGLSMFISIRLLGTHRLLAGAWRSSLRKAVQTALSEKGKQ